MNPSSPSSPTPPPFPGGTPPVRKKGLPPLAWAGIGCGGLLAVAIVAGSFLFGIGKRAFEEVREELGRDPAQQAAVTVVSVHPGLQKVSENESKGEMTVSNRATGEELTLSYEELASLEFELTAADGTTTPAGTTDLAGIPSWVPVYPRVDGSPRLVRNDTPAKFEGIVSLVASDSLADVDAFYDSAMSSSSSSSRVSTSFGDVERMSRTFREGKTTLEVIVSRSGSGAPLRVVLHYREDR
ncbi:hypothetical protein [Luteolibacter marinus]|uniref:hypothetical protein n=1 Tax=Luteolibacter marinus TaxID=2776705 RepID=UPI001865A767|nr:hypothetical protein [Luteolibacter marinus]